MFNGDLSEWDVSSVTDMSRMFFHASSFDRDISKWDVASVKRIRDMFWGVKSFAGSILLKWESLYVNDMYSMFCSATTSNSDISKWDVSNGYVLHVS